MVKFRQAVLCCVLVVASQKCDAFTTPSSSTTTSFTFFGPSLQKTTGSALNLSKDDGSLDSVHSSSSTTTTRRNWFTQTTTSTAAFASILASRTQPSNAATEEITTAAVTIASPLVSTPENAASNALCDPTVSILQRGSRTLYLLGTAHISADSAQLAGRLVRQVKPQAVFVELDAKRIGRAKMGPPPSSSSDAPLSPALEGATQPTSTALASSSGSAEAGDAAPATAIPESPTVGIRAREESPPPKTNPFNLKAKMMQASQALVGDAIKKLYQKLESQGFSAGEEFAIAIREGLALNSAIVLGDRDVDVTLRRLTEAFSKTDIKKLIAADSDFEKSMESYLPDTMKENIQKGMPGDIDMDADTLKTFVETMKTKENVKSIMTNLKLAAPELYEALVGERDLYMADGMNRLDQYESMVCVMGIAHLDGVERNLGEWGWKSLKPMC